MSRSVISAARRKPVWLLGALACLSLGATAAHAQASCQVTYTAPTWVGGNGFGASIDIKNTGAAITNGWSLVFNWPSGQQLQNGWPIAVTQSGTTVTALANQDWNKTLATNATFNVGMNATFNGANNPPASFTLNGTVCNGGGGTNTAPTVSLTSPTANQAFAAGAAVPLAATAADPGGAVVRVEFRVDGTLVNTDTSSPYSFSATGLAAGAHSVTATAVDNGTPALSTTSAAVSFTIGSGNTAPTVSLTSPTANQAFAAGAAIPLAATAADPGGAVVRVEFRVDGTLVNSDTTSPYSFSTTGLAAGTHTATATAVDNGTPALSTVSPPVTFTIGTATNSPPTVSLTSPTAGQSFAPAAAIPLAATASDPSGAVIRVEFRIDGALVGTDTTAPYTFTANSVAAGSHSAVATAFDNGTPSLSTASAAVAFVVQGAGVQWRVNAQGRITKAGTVFPVHCGAWFGLEGRHEPSTDPDNAGGAPMEQYIGNTFWANGGAGTNRTIQQTMAEISGMGINMIRIPLAPQALTGTDPQGMQPPPPSTKKILKNHASVLIPNSRLALETMITAAAQNNIAVLLDIHSCSNYVGWRKGRLDARPPYVDKDRDNYDFKREDSSCAATNNPAGVTRIQAYDQTKWLADLRTLAGLGAQLGVDNIIGIDIFNEPWDYTWADWKAMSEAAYQAINAVNPNTLIFVEGVSASANNQDGTPATITQVPHGDPNTVPNWGGNFFEAGTNPLTIPKDRLVLSPHVYGPSVFVQKSFMDPAQPACAGLEGDAAGNAHCNVVINAAVERAGWEEQFGYLKAQGYAMVVGEFGGNLDWPRGKASLRDQARYSYLPSGSDATWQNTFVDYMVSKGIEGCYWSINPESGDTGGWYDTAYDPVSNTSGWGEWRPFDARKTTLLNKLWGR